MYYRIYDSFSLSEPKYNTIANNRIGYKKSPTVNKVELFESERGDSNARPLRPERSALPTALLSDCGCKGTPFFDINKPFKEKYYIKKRTFPLHIRKIYLPLQPQNKKGALAQVVEHRTENPCVLGSTPRGTTPKKRIISNKIE